MAYSTIPKGSLYMDTKLYTGNNSPSNTISGIPFAPDLIWIKARGAATDHVLFDKVRGVYKSLSPNDSTAENNNTNQLQTFTSDGWTMGDLDTSNAATTFASWNWKANGTGSANTDGYLASTVSVNTTSGFSIVKYLGNGSANTVGHGLGVVPKMIIVKNLNTTDSWFVYHVSLGASNQLKLNETEASSANQGAWNNTSPTSALFTVGNSEATGGNGRNMIAYCFADVQGFSKFGSYIGNNNADGPMVYTGFKPAWIMIKIAQGTTNNWMMYDNQRSPFNLTDKNFEANNTGAEGTSLGIDMLSNGFKIRSTGNGTNYSGGTYIYMAFAENPFVATSGTNAIPVTAR